MKAISIDASPKQLSRLRNGHRVRVKQSMSGSGVNLLIDPSKFDAASRSFSKGSAYQMQLSPDELMANKSAVQDGQIEGQGIFAGGKLSSKKIGSALKKAGKATLGGLKVAESEVRKNPVSRTIIKEGAPLLVEEGIKAAWVAKGGDPKTGAKVAKVAAAGTKAGLKEAGYGLYAGAPSGRGIMGGNLRDLETYAAFIKTLPDDVVREILSSLTHRELLEVALPIFQETDPSRVRLVDEAIIRNNRRQRAESPTADQLIQQSDSPPPPPRPSKRLRGGAMCGGALPAPRSRMPEVSSIAIGGNLLARSNAQLPPALQSDPMGANFAMNTQLPPSFQRGGIRFV